MTGRQSQALLARAVQLHQTGQLDRAEAVYRDVLRTDPEQPDALHLLGVVALQRGRPADAVVQIRRAVAARPASAVYHGNLGVALQAVGRLGDARAALERAVALDPRHVDAGFNLGVTLQTLGQLGEAVERYQQVLALAPGHLGALRNLGNALAALGRPQEAVATYRRALAVAPGNVGLLGSLGAALAALGQTDEAIEAFATATAHAPGDAAAWLNLAVACHQAGRPAQAIDAYRRSLTLQPEQAEGWHSLGRALQAAGRPEEAVAAHTRALAVLAAFPASGDRAATAPSLVIRVRCDLGAALHEAGRTAEALAQFREAVSLDEQDAEARYGLAVTLQASGALDEALSAYRRALELDPANADAHAKLVFVLDLLPSTTPADALAARRAWNERHARPLATLIRPHANQPDPDRRLRVGYVSADFYRHSAMTAVLPILEAHDRAAVEVYCYASNAREDDQTARLRRAADCWRAVAGLADEALADLVRADAIDVLVDLSAYSGGHRLLTFARKPAPVQVTAWGYATGTGLDTIDAFFADPVVAPPDDQRWYAEELVYLPSVFCCAPPAELPPVAPAPLQARGAVTFGSFNRPIKMTPAALATWARVLDAVPDSRLVLKPGRSDSPETRARLLGALAGYGVAPERVEVLGLSSHYDHLAAYGEIDVQLDPFPQVGGVTTFEGLLMGVPCVTLYGERVPGRVSASFLTAAGLSDLVAHTPEQYVEIATRLADDRDRLIRERQTLRARLLASAVADAVAYTRAVEAGYRALWRRWTSGQRAAVSRQRRPS